MCNRMLVVSKKIAKIPFLEPEIRGDDSIGIKLFLGISDETFFIMKVIWKNIVLTELFEQ